MAIDYGDSAKKQIEAGLGVNRGDMPASVKKGIDSVAEIVRARTDAASGPAESFNILTEAMTSYNEGPSREAFQNLVDQNVADKALTGYDADPTKTLSSAELAVPTPGGRQQLRDRLAERHVSAFLAGASDLSAYRTGTLDTEMGVGRIDGAMVTKVEESVNREIDNRVASLEGKTPMEILGTYNSTNNPELKSRIGAKFSEELKEARSAIQNSDFLNSSNTITQFETDLQNEISGRRLTPAEADKAREDLNKELNRRVAQIRDDVISGRLSLVDATNMSTAATNPEFQSRLDTTLDLLDSTTMNPGGTDAASTINNLLNGADFNNLGPGVRSVLQAEAEAQLHTNDAQRVLATNAEHLVNIANDIEGPLNTWSERRRTEFYLRRLGPVAVVGILAALAIGSTFFVGMPPNVIFGLLGADVIASIVIGLQRATANGGMRGHLSRNLKEAQENIRISQEQVDIAAKARQAASHGDTLAVQNLQKANAQLRASRIPPEARAKLVDNIIAATGANISVGT